MKWLLHLLADDEPTVVILASKILARLLVVNGPEYVKKFTEKTGGISIMQYRLKRWWNIPTIWPICFAVLFGRDIATINIERTFDLYSLLENFTVDGEAEVVYPELLLVITAMLQNGLKSIVKDQEDPESTSDVVDVKTLALQDKRLVPPKHVRRRSMSLNTELASLGTHLIDVRTTDL